MKNKNITTSDSLAPQPLPRSEMTVFVKRNMRYADICNRIGRGEFDGDSALLDRIVNLVVDLQYADGDLPIGKELLPVETVAHQVLQLRQYEAQYVLYRLRHCPGAEITDQCILGLVFGAVGSIEAYRYAAKNKLETT